MSRSEIVVLLAAAALPVLGADQPNAAPLPAPRGKITRAASQDWDRIPLAEAGCRLVNNVWNKAASAGALKQEIFVEELDGRTIPGWRWSTPPRFIPLVVSQPQIVCGDKPWDTPVRARSDLPFRAGSQRLTVDYAANLRASGVYNLSFTMWATAGPSEVAGITHEIMIWVAHNGQRPAGRIRGSVEIDGGTFAVWVHENHGELVRRQSQSLDICRIRRGAPSARGLSELGSLPGAPDR